MANEYTNKNSTFRGLLRDKNIYGVMKDAIDSPIGSTSRKRATSMISVLKKANLASGADTMSYGIYDGKGGPGVDQTATTTPQLSQDYSNFRVLPAAPAPNSSKSWQDLVNTSTTKIGPLPYQEGLISKGAGTAYDWLGRAVPGAIMGTVGAVAGVAGGVEYAAKRGLRGTEAIVKSVTGYDPNVMPIEPYTPYSETWGAQVRAGLKGDEYVPSPVTGVTPTPGAMQGPIKEEGATATEKTATTAEFTTGAGITGGSTQPRVPTPSYTGSTGMIQQAIDRGIGPSAFALRVRSDPQGFKKFMRDQLGVEIADEDLPSGSSLSAQVADIEKAARLQWNIDGLLNQKKSLVETGITVERDLKDYIRGRDEYLTETQRMIENAESDMITKDLSNPATRRDYNNYMNYLYSLRGSQNKRYNSFLNSAKDQYNRELTAATNDLETNINAYERDVKNKVAITSEEFNMYNTAIMEMYTNVENSKLKKLQMQQIEAQLNGTNTGTIRDAAGNVTNGGDYAKEVGIVSKLPAGARLVETVKVDDREVSVLSPDMTSIQQAVNDLTANGSVSSPYSVMRMIKSGMQGSLETSRGLKETTSMGEKFMGMIKEKLDMAADEQTQQEAVDLAGEIAPTLSRSVSVGIKKDPNTLNNISNATKHISSPGWFGLRKVPTKQEAINKFPEVDPEVLNALYSMISQYKQDNGMSAASTNDILVGTKTRGQQKISNLTPDEVADFVGEAMGANMYRAIFPQ